LTGQIEISNTRVFAIAGPVMLTNVTTPLLGVVATAAIGRLGDAALLGGVAMASVAFDCLFWLFGFLRMGTVGFTAQALGADDTLEQRAVLARALMIAAAIGIVILALQRPFATLVFDAMGGSADVTAAARRYFFVRAWSAPFALGNYVILGWLVGLARVRTAMAIQIGLNIVNMAMMVVLVLGLDMGVVGAAAASVIAEMAGFVAGIAVAWHILGGRLALPRAVLFDRARLTRMLAVNRDIMIRTAALIAAYAFFTARGARSGDVTLAANAVLQNFMLVGSFFLDGIATAAEQLCGQAYGASDRDAFAQAVRLIVIWGLAFGLAATALYAAGGSSFIQFMTTSSEVQTAARHYLWFAALGPACGVMAFCFDGIYIGATWARDMRNLMLAALAAYFIAWWLLQSLGNAGLWIAFLVFYLARGALQAARYPALVRTPFTGAMKAPLQA
jgi:MATE family, multidrug efflux pump